MRWETSIAPEHRSLQATQSAPTAALLIGDLGNQLSAPGTSFIKQRLIADIDGINETRARRQVHRGGYGAPAFLYVALFGFVWTVALLSVYPPGNGSIVFICFFCAFIGIVIYLTLGLTYNFIGLEAVSPEPLQYLANFVRNL